MKPKYLFLLLFTLFAFWATAQKEMYTKGLRYYEAGNYEKAREFFYADKYGNANKDLLIRRLISNYHLGQLQEAKTDVSILLNFDNIPDETYLFIGKIFQSEGEYKRAIDNYKVYLKRLSPKDDSRDKIIHTIKQCGFATRYKFVEPMAFVDNFGPIINSKADEFRMLQSPNFSSKYYFSSDREGSEGGKRNPKGLKDEEYGQFNSDMYAVEMVEGVWQPPFKLNPFINTSRDEIALDFSSDGSILYYMKGPSYEQGTIYTDTFAIDKENNLTPQRFSAPINAERGDVYLHFYNDSTIVFSSNRDGGYGGYDLYVTAYRYGQWSDPKNLGASINGPFNEVAPHMSQDGSTIFFSSDRVESLGGYDVFKCELKNGTTKWNDAVNVGLPINSGNDDLGFYLSSDGTSASVSSDRKQGYGGFDLYMVYFKNPLQIQVPPSEQLAFIQDMEFVVPPTPTVIKPKIEKVKEPKQVLKKVESSSKQEVAASKQVESPEKQNITTTKDIETPTKKVVETSKEIASATDVEPEKVEAPKQNADAKKKKVGSKKKKKKKTRKANRLDSKKEVAKAENNTSKKTKTAEKESSKTVRKQEYVLNTIYYVSDKEIITPTNRKELDVIADMLITFPALTLEIKAHTRKEGLEAYDLYFSVKRAEQIAEYLIQKSIEPHRIHLKGYGSNYPVAKRETGGAKSKIAEKVNSRIEFKINNVEDQPLRITIVEPYLVDYLRDPKGELFKTIEDGLSYRVQIANVKQMYQNQVLLLYNDSMIEKDGDEESYRYTVGLYERYQDAKDLAKDLANYNITGAFIVPYVDGQRIPKDKITEFAKYYSDLLNYMQYNDE